MEQQRVLILVHPGSVCGSAEMALGRQQARCQREQIIEDIEAHRGDTLVLDGFLSDEIPDYPMYHAAIERAATRTQYSMRQFACDSEGDHFTILLPEILRASAWNDPKHFRFDVTGAWFFENDRSGCVNGVCAVLRDLGFRFDVLDSAARDPDGNFDEEE